MFYLFLSINTIIRLAPRSSLFGLGRRQNQGMKEAQAELEAIQASNKASQKAGVKGSIRV